MTQPIIGGQQLDVDEDSQGFQFQSKSKRRQQQQQRSAKPINQVLLKLQVCAKYDLHS